MDRFLSEYHVFLCPVAATPAFEHRRPGKALMVDGARLRYGDALGGYNCPLAVTGVPVATLPIGFTEQGLPIGVQICARRWQDESLLAIAAEMEALGEGFRQPPDFQ
jgi:amidase